MPGGALVGCTLAGTFMVDRLLGAGATGEVYVATRMDGGRAAIKVLHRHLAGDEVLARRFLREARAASLLDHPACVRIFAYGEDQGAHFIAMELLAGRDLQQVLRAEGPLPPARAATLVAQVLGALDEAHKKGVIHRDLKPENVMVTTTTSGREAVKVLDFGLATIASERDASVTADGRLSGTPEFMSPEQARGEELDGRSDLYAVACLLYLLVCGDVPFRAGSPLKVITKHILEAPEPPSRRAGRPVAPALEALILRGLEKEREQRFPSAAAMREALLATAT